MIEHEHWKRTNTQGIGNRNQHIAIVGYSHYRKKTDDKDSDQFTQTVMKSYLSGDRKMGAMFFPPIERYFGYENRVDFWNRVHFFNFIPECFLSDKKFASGNLKLVKRAQTRFDRILSLEKPDKVFVFSRKGWNQCPDTSLPTKPLEADHRDTWGTYTYGTHDVSVCGFRHPLYASAEQVKRSVQEFLAM
jgi:hypothetical protein